jgi:hypothetical protein
VTTTIDRTSHTYADDLEAEAKGKECLNCEHYPIAVAWLGGEHRLKCNCPEGPKLVKRRNENARRLAKMVQTPNTAMVVNEETAEITTKRPDAPLTIKQFQKRQELIQYVVAQMVEGIHYGVIPGTSDRSLWEPGAEYLAGAFNIQWDYDLTVCEEKFETFDFRYEYRVYQLIGDGIRVGGWTGSAWSRERKFYCKGGAHGCYKPCPQDHGPLGMEPQMLPHNVKDRALKRAYVGFIRNRVGVTGYFKQDLALDTNGGNGAAKTLCRIHNVAVTEKDGRFGTFWSHKNGKKWCNPKGDDLVIEATGEVPASPQDEVAEAPEKKEEE